MSWYERARRATSKQDESAGSKTENRVTKLRSQVEHMLNVDELATLRLANPELARNEVRSACRRAFERPEWTGIGGKELRKLVDRLLDLLFGMGVIEDLIADPEITEVMVNGPDKVFFERNGVIEPTEYSFSDEAELRALIDRILGPLGRRIDEASPMVNARLPQGHRVNVVVPPIAIDGPAVTIRKFREHVITLAEMESYGSLAPGVRAFLSWAVKARKSIAISGGTGSGKTTLLNALSCEIPPEERIVTIEDSAELRFHEHPHVVRLEARPRNAEGTGEVTIRDLVINSLRMRPDRIVVGEVRGSEAQDMLQAMITGHDGSLTTLHANAPTEAITRLSTMVRYGADLPVDVIERTIASAIDLVVQTQRLATGERMVTQIVSFAFDEALGRCVVVPIFNRESFQDLGTWERCPEWVEAIAQNHQVHPEEVVEWKASCGFAA